MDKLIRAMCGLLLTVVAVPGAATFALKQADSPPEGAARMGTQSLVPGCVVLEVSRRGNDLFERYFYGYWEHA